MGPQRVGHDKATFIFACPTSCSAVDNCMGSIISSHRFKCQPCPYWYLCCGWCLFRADTVRAEAPSIQFSHSVISDSLRLHESQHARPPYPSPARSWHIAYRVHIAYCILSVALSTASSFRIWNSSTRILSLPGASVRHSARGKGHEEGGSAYAKAGSSFRSPPGNSRAEMAFHHDLLKISP